MRQIITNPGDLAMLRAARVCVLHISVATTLLSLSALAHADGKIDQIKPVTDAMLANPDPADWLMWRRTLNNWGYSPLKEITPSNVKQLRLVWTRPLAAGDQEGTALVHDGILYFPNPNDITQAFDAVTGDNLTVAAVIPATYRLSETMRINVNGGWLWDRTADRHFALYGIGFDWKFTDTLQWTIEAFGQAGAAADTPSTVRPRVQTGIRYRPNEIFSVDFILGHNITGEGANWFTLGTTIRFPVEGGKPARERTGHL